MSKIYYNLFQKQIFILQQNAFQLLLVPGLNNDIRNGSTFVNANQTETTDITKIHNGVHTFLYKLQQHLNQIIFNHTLRQLYNIAVG